MIRVAAGEKLSIAQGDVKFNGWAVESRVYAEDPYRNFLPSTGRLTRYRPPREESAHGMTVRNDTGVYEGGEISLFYDPMIAKLVTHASTRGAAINAQSDALDRFVIDGIPPQCAVSCSADGTSPLAGRQAFHRLHRRRISRRISRKGARG
jgi:propionyl-CoA carboxylase alpha chain